MKSSSLVFLGLLCLYLSAGETKTFRRTDLRFYGMGGAFTGLPDTQLMSYYNPAAYAFSGMKNENILVNLDDDMIGKSKTKPVLNINLASLTISTSFGDINNYTNDLNVINTFAPFPGIAFPSPFDILLAQLGLGVLNSKPTTTTSSDYLTTLTNGGFASQVALIRDKPLRLLMDLDLLNIQAKNFGFGIDGAVSMTANLPTVNTFLFGIPFPVISVIADTTTYFSLAFPFKTSLPMAVGFTAKGFLRTALEIDTENKLLTLLSDINGPVTGIQNIASNPLGLLTDKINLGTASNYLKIGYGGGLDIGYMIEPLPHLYAGAMLNDAFSLIHWVNSSNELVPFTLDLGGSWSPPLSLFGYFENPIVSVSVNDLWGRYGDEFYKRIHVGVEFGTLFDAVRLRIGLYQGWTSYSASMNFNSHFLAKVPIVKIFFPKDLPLWPLILPESWDYDGLLDYTRRNILVFAGVWGLRFLTFLNFSLEAGLYNMAIPSGTANYQGAFNFRLGLTF